MIQSLVDQWYKNKHHLEEKLTYTHPSSYRDLVEMLVDYVLTEEVEEGNPISPNRIHIVDDGEYQGTQIYLIGLQGYQPQARDYLWFPNSYGSCSGCDTLVSIRYYQDDPPAQKQVDQYMTLALHMVQRMKWLEPRD